METQLDQKIRKWWIKVLTNGECNYFWKGYEDQDNDDINDSLLLESYHKCYPFPIDETNVNRNVMNNYVLKWLVSHKYMLLYEDFTVCLSKYGSSYKRRKKIGRYCNRLYSLKKCRELAGIVSENILDSLSKIKKKKKKLLVLQKKLKDKKTELEVRTEKIVEQEKELIQRQIKLEKDSQTLSESIQLSLI